MGETWTQERDALITDPGLEAVDDALLERLNHLPGKRVVSLGGVWHRRHILRNKGAQMPRLFKRGIAMAPKVKISADLGPTISSDRTSVAARQERDDIARLRSEAITREDAFLWAKQLRLSPTLDDNERLRLINGRRMDMGLTPWHYTITRQAQEPLPRWSEGIASPSDTDFIDDDFVTEPAIGK